MIISYNMFKYIYPFCLDKEHISPYEKIIVAPNYYIFTWGVNPKDVYFYPVEKIIKYNKNSDYGIVSKIKSDHSSYTYYHQVSYGTTWSLMDIKVYDSLFSSYVEDESYYYR